MQINSNISNYSVEAQEALKTVIQDKGGQEALETRLRQKQILADEVNRIKRETIELVKQGADASFIKNTTRSGLLSAENMNEIIEEQYANARQDVEDQQIKPRTIFGSIIGTTIASILGGVLWGLQLIYSARIFYMLLIGLILLCYGIIRISTGQTKKNSAVLIATMISVILSILIGSLLYEMVGYKG
ncbi:MAG TPA: hypothetical protein VK563_05500 [Puia sp.]|nr:hypothetical protein [Puia sp.]